MLVSALAGPSFGKIWVSIGVVCAHNGCTTLVRAELLGRYCPRVAMMKTAERRHRNDVSICGWPVLDRALVRSILGE